MRRPTSALASAFFGTALAASTVLAQQSPPSPTTGMSGGSSTSGGASSGNIGSIPGVVAAPRAPRPLLRNGWDYIGYQEYERALAFLREAELRKSELNPSERLKLKQGIERAQQGIRDSSIGMNNEPAYSRSGRSKAPGAIALSKPSAASDQGTIQLAGGLAAASQSPNADNVRASIPASDPGPSAPAAMPAVPDLGPTSSPDPGLAKVAAPDAAPSLTPTPEPIREKSNEPVPIPSSNTSLTTDDGPLPTLPTELTNEAPPLSHAAAPMTVAPPQPAAPEVEKLPTLPDAVAAPTGSDPAPVPAPLPEPGTPAPAPVAPPALASPEVEKLPTLPDAVVNPPISEPAPTLAPIPSPASVPETPPAPEAPPVVVAPDPQPLSNPDAPPVSTVPPPPLTRSSDSLIPYRAATPPSTLTPELQREVERIAKAQDDEMKRNPFLKTTPGMDVPDQGPAGTVDTSRLVISRAPSPTEARPIRAIPVPEEFVPLPKREWDANRKYWAAAATCHFPLYFQDATLERYGYGVEQRFGTFGRYLSYPIDDPKQSKQRNQLAQPFISAGLFAAQIVLLPYHMLVDPPWESEYDLGFYRPGDRVPTDVLYLPLTGVGPPLAGNHYGAPPTQSRW